MEKNYYNKAHKKNCCRSTDAKKKLKIYTFLEFKLITLQFLNERFTLNINSK